ncbi:TauD/TfdA dioxygenase family protein [Priestia aryabhattai]|uniref:TauD/TfdA dioxygenase family protein n=1 Tax=Priestia aryabhattai TaxID=412384 RepID=UPI002E2358EB|nr:TauD/TfdA family dioxygenase [Priestia aryabhattai]MED3885001.1 TauD/TfdA family dioxygenase [Priestia aryabhattai]MED4259081.1 TauD/TfdA family dioxygenase [Priestia aryabhattai]
MSNNLSSYPRALHFPNREVKEGPHLLKRLPNGVEEKPYTFFSIKPLTPTIGAEIEGLDLSKPLAKEVQEELNRAFLEWKVLFFRNQEITSEQHLAFAKLWGDLEVHPFYKPASQEQAKEIVQFSRNQKQGGSENVWHADVTFRENPAKASVLRLIEVPPVGGDTLWADMAAAYDNLPESIKKQIEHLKAIHDFTPSFAHLLQPDELKAFQREFPEVEHPIVRTHPETGRKTLFVNSSFTTHVVGLEHSESEQLLQYLFRQAHVPEYQVRFRWEANSIALWDNRATQHYAVSDYYPHSRKAERAAIIGDRPF